MTYLDYNARAELFLGSDSITALAQGARTFRTAAQAILFAVEHAAPVSLKGASLIVGDTAYAGHQLHALYLAHAFPLPRRGDAPKASLQRRSLTPAKGNPNGHRLRRQSGSLRRQALRQERSRPVQALQLSF